MKDGFVELPVDCDGVYIRLNDVLYLKHNGKKVKVRSMELVGRGWNVWPYESSAVGGAISLPDAAFDVTHEPPIGEDE